MKVHLSFATANLAKSIEYYTILLDTPPKTVPNDFALFDAERPQLDLVLNRSDSVSSPSDAHFGIGVASVNLMDRMMARLQGGRYRVDVEGHKAGTFSDQTKVWSEDPDGRRWEVYLLQ